MTSTPHTFCIPTGCNNISRFRAGTLNPTILRRALNSLTDSTVNPKPHAFIATPFTERATFDINVPPNIVSDFTNLPIVPQSPISELGECVSLVSPVLSACTSTDVYEQFLCIMNFISGAREAMTVFSIDPAVVLGCGPGLKFYVIFDGKLAVFYGTFIVSMGTDLILDISDTSPFIFPPTFTSFSFGLYDPTTKKYYVALSL
jgi:hypothetical protein